MCRTYTSANVHEYQLDRLNTRSFEQLVQSLGTAIIGPRLMVFGDGPDFIESSIRRGPHLETFSRRAPES